MERRGLWSDRGWRGVGAGTRAGVAIRAGDKDVSDGSSGEFGRVRWRSEAHLLDARRHGGRVDAVLPAVYVERARLVAARADAGRLHSAEERVKGLRPRCACTRWASIT